MAALMNAAPTMSSREIADLVEVRHDSVKRTIERLAQKGVIGLPPLVEYLDSLGRKASEYRIGKRDSYVIVAQLSPEFTARLVDRWQELEQGTNGITAEGLLANPRQLLALTQGYALQIEDMRRDIEGMQQDVEAFDRIANADGTFGIREAAKALKKPEREFVEWLRRNNWCYRPNGRRGLLGYAETEKRGFLTHKVSTFTKPDGSEGVQQTVRITTAGLTYLAKRFSLSQFESALA